MKNESKAAMIAILNENPGLSRMGFESWFPARLPPDVAREFHRKRDELLSDCGLEEFERARRWLQKFYRRKSVNRRCSSYTWKHRAESEEGDYVSNGALIAAAISLGFEVRHIFGTPNAYVGVGERLSTAESPAHPLDLVSR